MSVLEYTIFTIWEMLYSELEFYSLMKGVE